MKKVFLFMAIVSLSIAFTSCTAEDISESARTHADDTGGQNGHLPPPPVQFNKTDTGGQGGSTPIKP